MADYCTVNNIAIPRILLTEHGPDAMGDIDVWLKALRMTPPYNTIRGFKTLQNQWRIWFPEWSLDQSYFEQLKYLSENVYVDSPVEAQMIFCYGHTAGGQWEQFDIENSSEFMTLLEKYVSASTSTPDPIPNVPVSSALPNFPSDFDARSVEATLTTTGKVNVRAKPSTSSDIIGAILGSVNGRALTINNLKPNEVVNETINNTIGTWIPISYAIPALPGTNSSATIVIGWVFNALVKIEAIKKPDPIPTIPVPAPTPVPEPEPEPSLNRFRHLIIELRSNFY